MTSPFRVVVLNSAGDAQGELLTVTSILDTRQLDAIGSCEFTLPGNDPHANLITAGAQFDIFDEVDGYLGRYTFRESRLQESKGIPELEIRCDDALVELRRTNVGFRRNYYLEPVELVVEDLVSLASGWRVEVDAGIGDTAVTYEGESVLVAVDELRDRWGKHYRLKTNDPAQPKYLQFGAFGVDSGVILTNLQGQLQPDINSRTYVALVEKLNRAVDAEQVVNRIIPLGAGQGEGQLTILGATDGAYPILTAANRNGTLYRYIQDDASVATYGVRPRVLTATNIRPIDNNNVDRLRAANALKLFAENYLLQHLGARTEYSLTVRGLRTDLRVGDLARLYYEGVTDHINWLDVNELFYVLEIARKRTAAGERSAKLKIADIATRRTADSDVMIDVVRDIRALKMHIQPQAFWSENTYIEPIASDGFTNSYAQLLAQTDNGVGLRIPRFKVQIDQAVTALHKVRLRWRTRPMYSLTRAVVDAPSNLGRNVFYIIESHYFPFQVHIFIDGVDVTTLYGGPWGLSNIQAVVDMDVTDYFTTGELTSEHIIEFRCWTRLGDIVFSAAATGGANAESGETSTGLIELNVRIQGTAQAVISS